MDRVRERGREGPGRSPLTIVIAFLLAGVWGCAHCSSSLPAPGQISAATIAGFHNPEDIEVVQPAGLLLVSENDRCGRGAISALPLPLAAEAGSSRRPMWPRGAADDFERGDVGDDRCQKQLPDECLPILAKWFSPHGIATTVLHDGTVRVAVVNHRPDMCLPKDSSCAAAFDGRDGIELLDLRGGADGRRLAWRGCVRMPSGTHGNDLALLPDGTLIVANCTPHGLWSFLAGGFFPVGNLQRWPSRHDGQGSWETLPGSESHNPNGVLVTGDAVFFSATTSGELVRLPLEPSASNVGRTSICIGGYPDNLSLTPRGTILIATHTSLSRLIMCARGGCGSPWAVYEIKQDLSQYRPVAASDGSEISLVSSAVLSPYDDPDALDRFVVGSILGERLGTFTAPTAPWQDAPCRR
jgi:hypothetical protein